jgi:phage gpG-like protein
MSENQFESIIRIFTRLSERMRDMTPVYDELSEIMIESVQTNFEQGGRPDKWKRSKRARGEDTGGDGQFSTGRTLINKGGSGGLLGSIHRVPSNSKVIIAAGKVYAAAMHFGAQKGEFGTVMARVGAHNRMSVNGKEYRVMAHTRSQMVPWGNIPARPFMMIQTEDIEEMNKAVIKYLTDFGGDAT